MKVVLLCGGVGKRMHPIRKEKFLLNFLGETLLERHIRFARELELSDFVVVGNEHNIEKIKDVCKDIDANFDFVVQTNKNGMAGALISAEDVIKNDEILVVKPTDIVEKTAYEKLINESKNGSYDSYILGYVVERYFPGGYLSINKNNEMIDIVEKPGEGNEPSNLINIVLHVHKRTDVLLRYMKETKRSTDDVYEYSMKKMVKDGYKFKVVKYDGFWTAITYPWKILETMNYFLNIIDKPVISSNAKIHETAVIDGNVIIEDGARVFEHAVIRGPAYIGKNSIVGNHALIRNSHIGNNSVVGKDSEIKGSYIGDNCWFHTNYVGDSVISDNCSFGSGAVTANFRFDEKNIKVKIGDQIINTGLDKLGVIMGENSKVGINACLMPGVRIGPNSMVGPGSVLFKDLEQGKILLLRDTFYEIKDNNITLSKEKKDELMRRM